MVFIDSQIWDVYLIAMRSILVTTSLFKQFLTPKQPISLISLDSILKQTRSCKYNHLLYFQLYTVTGSVFAVSTPNTILINPSEYPYSFLLFLKSLAHQYKQKHFHDEYFNKTLNFNNFNV